MSYLVANIVAFDCVSDMLRGLRGSMLDMYQVPDKLLAAVEMFIPWTVAQTVWMAQTDGKHGGVPGAASGRGRIHV